MRLPIRARLTLIFGALFAIVFGVTGFLVHQRFGANLLQTVDAGLRYRAQTALGRSGEPSIRFRDENALAEGDEAIAQILRDDGTILDSSQELAEQPLVSPAMLTNGQRTLFFTDQVTVEHEVMDARLLAVPFRDGGVLVVGTSLEQRQEALNSLASLLWSGGLIALGVTTWLAWVLADAALRPVEHMRAQAAAISASELGRRLPTPDTGDEIARLGETLNNMLERLETALERERRFVDDASHELRTPLGILRTELELALKRARTRAELEAALRSAAEESDHLVRLAEDLLVLARAAHGQVPVRVEEVDLVDLVRDVTEPFATEAAKRGVEIHQRHPGPVRANVDPLRIRQALGNLLHNALQHTPPGGTVEVAVTTDNGSLSIGVNDTGEGFPPGFAEQAFEPFTRADAARRRSDGGVGLGLSIVRVIAEAHGGAAEASNQPGGGAAVIVRLPADLSQRTGPSPHAQADQMRKTP
jgi:two-component system OmpR family sensor kinase